MESFTVAALLFSVGIVAIAKGGDWFADSAVWFASYSGVPKVLIGATIVSLATTIPEFTVSLIAALSGAVDTAVGNAVGSTICNIGLILALAALIHPVRGAERTFRLNGVIMILSAGLVFLLALDGALGAVDGLVLLAATAAYLGYQYRRAVSMRRAAAQEPGAPRPPSRAELPRNLSLFVVGAMAVVVGSRLVVSNGVVLARMLGVSEMVIALTLVSVGTSLPELVTAITAARKGHPDLSAGNIIGANVLDLTWVLAGASLANRLPILPQTRWVDVPVSLFFMVLLVGSFTVGRRILGRPMALVMLAAYALYVYYLVETGSLAA